MKKGGTRRREGRKEKETAPDRLTIPCLSHFFLIHFPSTSFFPRYRLSHSVIVFSFLSFICLIVLTHPPSTKLIHYFPISVLSLFHRHFSSFLSLISFYFHFPTVLLSTSPPLLSSSLLLTFLDFPVVFLFLFSNLISQLFRFYKFLAFLVPSFLSFFLLFSPPFPFLFSFLPSTYFIHFF